VLAAHRAERLKKIQADIQETGGQAVYQVTNVTSIQEMEDLADYTLKEFGKIDVIVNNAGVMPLSHLNEKKITEWELMIDVNIKGVLYGIAAVLPYMRKQKESHIINVSSIAGHLVFPGSAVYSGTKFAVCAITEGVRIEEASNNIRTTIISPGTITKELAETISGAEMKSSVIANMKIGIHPSSIARAIASAIEQPSDVAVNEMIIRPTVQLM
jgi:NADP-dependent 3-hydroxy acid dehydrogenase YdfG